MRVLLVQNRFYPAIGGAETHVYLLSKYLAKKGHDVTVYTTNSLSSDDVTSLSLAPPFIRRGKTKRDLPLEETLNGVKVKRFDFKFRYWSFNWIPDMFKELKETVKNFDIIHAHGYHVSTSLVSCYYARKWNKPFILTGHLLTIPEDLPLTAKFFKKIYDSSFGRWLIRNSSKLIATTEDNAKEYKQLGAEEDKIIIIPNGIELEDYFNNSEISIKSVEEKYGIEKNHSVLLFVGRIERYKGIQEVIEIMPIITRSFPDIKFIVVGQDYGFKSELIRLARKLEVLENILFTGAVPKEDLIALYKRADIFVFPSRNENFGIVLLEAMATKTLCIAYSIPSVRNIIKDGKNGILVKNKSEFLDKILYYLNNIDEKKRLKQKL